MKFRLGIGPAGDGGEMEPVDPIRDFLTTRGTVAACTLSLYDPSKDYDNNNPWATPVDIRGSHGIERTTSGHGQGDIATTVTDWWITSTATGLPELDRPLLRSKIASCGKTWLILEVSPNPRNRRLFQCHCQLIRE